MTPNQKKIKRQILFRKSEQNSAHKGLCLEVGGTSFYSVSVCLSVWFVFVCLCMNKNVSGFECVGDGLMVVGEPTCVPLEKFAEEPCWARALVGEQGRSGQQHPRTRARR